jgi:predicted nuclease of predicted toxin-antitoxin system
MKVKLDENVSSLALEPLRLLGHDVDSVIEEQLAGADDDAVWAAAQRELRLLVTSDLDFSDVRKFAPGTHHGLVLLRLRDPSRRATEQRVLALFERGEAESWSRCFGNNWRSCGRSAWSQRSRWSFGNRSFGSGGRVRFPEKRGRARPWPGARPRCAAETRSDKRLVADVGADSLRMWR